MICQELQYNINPFKNLYMYVSAEDILEYLSLLKPLDE
jgi:hypothetical protein